MEFYCCTLSTGTIGLGAQEVYPGVQTIGRLQDLHH